MLTDKVELKGLKLRHGMKGVLSKDNKTAFAAGTLHVTSLNGWKSPRFYSPASLLNALMDESAKEIELIDLDNNRFVLEIKR